MAYIVNISSEIMRESMKRIDDKTKFNLQNIKFNDRDHSINYKIVKLLMGSFS